MNIRNRLAAIGGGIVAAAALLFGVPAVIRHNSGASDKDYPAAFERMKSCALRYAPTDTGLENETLDRAVNAGVHVVSDDSLHKLLPGQAVAALTRWTATVHDTSIAIYTAPPVDIAMIEHEFANALSIRHRRALTGSDSGKMQSSPFYTNCVRYCPRCGAY